MCCFNTYTHYIMPMSYLAPHVTFLCNKTFKFFLIGYLKCTIHYTDYTDLEVQ